MGILDEAFRDLATTLVGTFVDSTSKITRVSPGTYNPATGGTTGGGSTDYSVKCSPFENFSIQEIDGTNVLANDLRTRIAAQDIAISPSPQTDVLVVNAVTYKIVKCTPEYSGDQVALWTLQVRR